MKQKIVSFYHADCVDGIAAHLALIHPLALSTPKATVNHRPEDVAGYSFHYKKSNDFYLKYANAVNDADLYILDFSFPLEVTEAFIQRANKVVMVDHHEYTPEYWEGLNGLLKKYPDKFVVIYDQDYSGAVLTWEYLYNTVPTAIRLVGDRDTFKFHYPNTKDFFAGLMSYKMPNEVTSMLTHLINEELKDQPPRNLNGVVARGSVLHDYANSLYNTVTNESLMLHDLTWRGKTLQTFSVNVPHCMASDLLDRELRLTLAARDIDYDKLEDLDNIGSMVPTFGIGWFVREDGIFKFSVRGKAHPTHQLLPRDLAIVLGGGGHPKAAGFTIDPKDIDFSVKNWLTHHIQKRIDQYELANPISE